jgi:hypothetical protein
MWFLSVIKALQAQKAEFAVVGGYAVALHGVVRGTIDLDLAVALHLENFKKVESTLKTLGLESRLPICAEDVAKFRKEYIAKRNLIAWTFVNYKDPSKVVDILITHQLNRRDIKYISVQGVKVPVLSKKKLIGLKRKAGRPQDLEDVRALESRDEKG